MQVSNAAARIRHLFRTLARCERGSVFPLFLASTGVIVGASVGGLDLARHADVTTRLQYALDTAALAMGRLAATESDPDRLLAEARRYFEINFPPNFQGTRITADKIRLNGNSSGTVLTLSVEGALPLLSTGFLDISSATLSTKSTITLEGNPNLEIVFTKDVNSQDNANALSERLEDLGNALLEKGNGSVFIGTVPYTDAVNVGTGEKQRYWVARWLEDMGKSNVASSAANYHTTLWNGCIAEPRPWENPGLRPVSALNPNAAFVPLFVRVETTLTDKKNPPAKAISLRTGEWENNERLTQYYKQPISIEAVGNSDLRYFWSRFVPGPGNSPQSHFDILSLHEPANCDATPKMQFLENGHAAVEALQEMAAAPSAPAAKSLPPAGLLWSWRMLSDNWRTGNGWNAAHVIHPDSEPTRAIVLITSGAITSWSQLESQDSAGAPYPVWTDDPFNYFNFLLRYHSDNCKGADHNKGDENTVECKNGRRAIREYVHTAPLGTATNSWQYPVSSLAMANPFAEPEDKLNGKKNSHPLNTSGWPAVSEYMKRVCDAIKGNSIHLFVLAPQFTDAGLPNRSDFLHCSSDSRIYTLDDANTLEQALLNLRSDSAKLRLVPLPST